VDFPVDVLVIILSFLHIDHLHTARIVCKAFREASNLCVTGLSFGSCESEVSCKELDQRLRVFKAVKWVDLTIHRVQSASLLRRPAVMSCLRKLRLTCNRPHVIIPLVAAAPHLTKLEVEVKPGSWCKNRKFRSQLVEALRSCRCSVELTCLRAGTFSNYNAFNVIGDTPILRLIWYGDNGSGLPAGQLALTHFTRLESLELVTVETEDEIEAVATLTRLTRLVKGHPALRTRHLVPLSKLTALQELDVQLPQSRVVRDFRLVVSPLVQLRQLKLGGRRSRCFRDSDLAELDSLLAELPCSYTPGDAASIQHPAVVAKGLPTHWLWGAPKAVLILLTATRACVAAGHGPVGA
jgi:hypothetical protein